MGSIPGRVIPETVTTVHDASLLGTLDVTISKTKVKRKSCNFFRLLNLWTLTEVDVWQRDTLIYCTSQLLLKTGQHVFHPR